MSTARWQPWAVGGVLLLAWQLAAAPLPPYLMAGPVEVVEAIAARPTELAHAAWTTGSAAVVGLALASAVGLSAGAWFAASRAAERAFYPVALLAQTIPIIAIAPLLVVWLDYGWWVSTVSAAVVSFFPLLTGAHVGLRAATPEQIELFRLYGATPLQQLLQLRIPAAAPHLFAGLRTAGGLSVIGAVVGDFVGSNGQPPSLGNIVLKASAAADVASSFGAVVASALLALGLFVLTRTAERALVGHWFGDRSPPT